MIIDCDYGEMRSRFCAWHIIKNRNDYRDGVEKKFKRIEMEFIKIRIN